MNKKFRATAGGARMIRLMMSMPMNKICIYHSLSFHRNIRTAQYNNAHLLLLCSPFISKANLNAHLILPKPQLCSVIARRFSTTNLGHRHSIILMPTKGTNCRSGCRNPDVVISKALSFTLRHGAVKEGLSIRSDGYVSVADLVSTLSEHFFQFSE